MTCREFRDLAELLRDGALDPATAAAARAHLETCAVCRAFEEESTLCLAPVRELPPGPYLPPTSPWRPLPPWLGGGGAAVGIVLALLALGGAAAMGAFRPASTGPESAASGARETAGAEPTPTAAPEPAPPPPPPGPPRPALPPGTYEGKVVDEAGAAVAGAVVTVAGFPPATTDAAGLFSIPGVDPGPSRRIRIEARGCVALDGLAPPSWPAARTTLAAIPVGPPRAARVRVVAPDGRPAAGARVRAAFLVGELHPHSRPTYRAGDGVASLLSTAESTAGADGLATIGGLGPGPWTFTADLDGCAPSIPETGVPGGGGEGPDATILLEAGVPFEGRVLDPEGRPLPGAEVAWVRDSDRARERDLRHEGVVRAESDGGFRFERVPAVPLSLSVRHPEGSMRVGALLADPLLTPRVFLVAGPVGTRHGIATDEAGQPAEGAVLEPEGMIFTTASPGTDRPRARVGADGRFVLEGVPRAARWRVEAAIPGPWRAHLDLSSFALLPGERPPTLLSVRLARTGSIEGVVRGADGAPAAGVEVRAFAPHPWTPQLPLIASLARSDAAGRFVLDGVPAGPALVVPGDGAWDEAGGRTLREFAAPLAAPAGSSPHRVEVPAGGRVAADCPIWPDPAERKPRPGATRLRGTVLDERGAPVPGVRLFVLFGFPGMPETSLRPSMERTWPVAADGSFDAEFRSRVPAPAGTALPAIALAVAPDGRRGIAYAKPASGGVAEGVRVMLEADRPIEGRLLEPDGSPAAGALLDACPEADTAASPTMPRAATGPDGSFRIRGLPAGAARLFVDRPGRERVSVVVPADAPMPMEIRLPALRDVRGRVEGPDGAPAVGVFVEWRMPGSMTRPRIARSGPDGSFAFHSVPRVPFRLAAGAPPQEQDDGAFVQNSREFPADEAEPRLVLERAMRVGGTVEDSLGRPAAGAVVTAIVEQGERRLFRTTRAGPSGRFDVSGIPAGAPVAIEARAGTVRGAARVVEGGEDAAIRLEGTLPERGDRRFVEGRVLDAAGAPAGFGEVRALDPDTGCVVAVAGAVDRGSFTLEAPANREIALEADFGGGDCVYLDGFVAGAGPVVLQPGGARGTLRGRVVGPDGATLAGAAVTAVRRGPAPDGPAVVREGDERVPRLWTGIRSARSAADGSFDLGSPRGRWVVFAGTPGTPLAPRAAVPWDAERPADLEVATGPGWSLRVPPATAGSHRPEVAEVRFPGFLPADAAAVELRRVVPADGALEVVGLPPGPVEVILRTRDGFEVRRERVSPPRD